MMSTTLQKFHEHVAVSRGDTSVFSEQAPAQTLPAVVTEEPEVESFAAPVQKGPGMVRRVLTQMIALVKSSRAQSKPKADLPAVIEAVDQMPATPLVPRIRYDRRPPTTVLLSHVRLGSGLGDAPRLSRRAAARLRRDPFVQRLDRLHQA